jgi:hypothetical protein
MIVDFGFDPPREREREREREYKRGDLPVPPPL